MNDDPEVTKDSETPTRSADDVARELAETREALARERAALQAEREAVAGLRDSLVAAVRPQVQPAPEPDEPLPGDDDFDKDRLGSTARVSAAVVKRALTSYDGAIRGELAELRRAQLDTEWERVKAEDPKNFTRLEKGMRQYLEQNDYTPGLVRNLFYRMRGEYMPRLMEMDRADREKEPTPKPNAPAGPRRSTTENHDVLSADEIKTIRGLGITPSSYFGLKHQREAKFEKGYLTSIGFQEETRK